MKIKDIHYFFMQIVGIIFLLALTSIPLVKGFVSSYEMNQSSTEMYGAMQVVSTYINEIEENEQIDKETTTYYYNNSWERVSEEEGVFKLESQVKEEYKSGGSLYHFTVKVIKENKFLNEEVLYELPFSYYRSR